MINDQNKIGCTALMGAARGGHEAIVQQLCNMGADHNLRTNDGMTALKYAASKGHKTIVKYFIDYPMNPIEQFYKKIKAEASAS